MDKYYEDFTLPTRRIGKTCLLLAILFSFISPIYVAIRYGCMPTVAQILGGFVLILATEGTYYFIEPISYYPTLGEAGNYMSFLAGSISAIRLTATLGSQDVIGVEPGSHRAEIVAVIAIAGSVICSTAMNLIGIVFGNFLFAVLPKTITGMFDFVLPALYGALLYPRFKKSPPVAIFGFVAGYFLYTSKLPGWTKMLSNVLLCILLGRQLAQYKKSKAAAK